jgi:hypothetical protein
MDIYAFAGMAWSALAAAQIPSRGMIVFGDFHVRPDSGNRHSLYFGDALIEAYEADKATTNRDWIGVNLCRSSWEAVEYAENNAVAMLTNENRLLRDGNVYRLNPFMHLDSVWKNSQCEDLGDLSKWIVPDSPNEIKALDFITSKAGSYSTAKAKKDAVARKYAFTARLLRSMLEGDCVKWALSLADSWRKPRE